MLSLRVTLAIAGLYLCFLSSLQGQTKEIIFIRHGESHMNAVYHSNPWNIIYRLSADREFLRDSNLNENGVEQALNLHDALISHARDAHSDLYSIANKILYPNDSVLFLTSNLRRAANTGLLVRYGLSVPGSLSNPLHIVSALQERFISPVFVDGIPWTAAGQHLDRLFEQGIPDDLKDFEPIQSDLFTTHWNLCGSGIQPYPQACGGNHYGDIRPIKERVKSVLDLIFSQSNQFGVDLSLQNTVVIFGHSLWLQQLLDILTADNDYRNIWNLVPNCSLFKLEIENQGRQYVLRNSKLYETS